MTHMSEELGHALNVVMNSLEGSMFNMLRSFAYGLWRGLRGIENEVFKAFNSFFENNPLTQIFNNTTYRWFFIIGMALLVVIATGNILYNLISNRPVDNKNHIFQTMVSILILVATPTLLTEMNSAINTVNTNISSAMSTSQNNEIYNPFFYDIRINYKLDTDGNFEQLVPLANTVDVTQLNINLLATTGEIGHKPTNLVDNGNGGVHWEVENIGEGKPRFIGVGQAYVYHVQWFPLFITTILTIGVSFMILIQIALKSLFCLYNSYVAPLIAGTNSGNSMKMVEFLGDYKNDLFFIFMSMVSLFMFRSMVGGVAQIDNMALRMIMLLALSFFTLNFSNDFMQRISGGSFRDNGARMLGAVGGAMALKAPLKAGKGTIKGAKAIGKGASATARGAKTLGKGANALRPSNIGKTAENMKGKAMKPVNAIKEDGKALKQGANNAMQPVKDKVASMKENKDFNKNLGQEAHKEALSNFKNAEGQAVDKKLKSDNKDKAQKLASNIKDTMNKDKTTDLSKMKPVEAKNLNMDQAKKMPDGMKKNQADKNLKVLSNASHEKATSTKSSSSTSKSSNNLGTYSAPRPTQKESTSTRTDKAQQNQVHNKRSGK